MARKHTPTPPSKPSPPSNPAPGPFAHTADPHWGRGGRYRIDPTTGQRVPAPTDAPVKE